MHLRISFCLFALLFSAAAISQTDSSETTKPFDIKSGKIVYTYVSGPISGQKILTFDDWGRTFKEEVTNIQDTTYTRSLLMFLKSELKPLPDDLRNFKIRDVQHILGIHTPTQTWTIDLDLQIGSVTDNDVFKKLPNFFSRKVVGRDTFLGKPCQVVELSSSLRIWYWKNIPIKKMSKNLNTDEHATLVDETYIIKPDEFKVPGNIKIR